MKKQVKGVRMAKTMPLVAKKTMPLVTKKMMPKKMPATPVKGSFVGKVPAADLIKKAAAMKPKLRKLPRRYDQF